MLFFGQLLFFIVEYFRMMLSEKKKNAHIHITEQTHKLWTNVCAPY